MTGPGLRAGRNPFEDATAADLLDAAATRWPEREAIVCGDERITFATLRTRAEGLARGLAALGLGHGDSVALWLPLRPAWFVAQQACARIGVVAVALNPRFRSHELTYILGQSDARALLMTDHLGAVDYFETLHEVLPELAHAVPGEIESARFPLLRHVIVDAEDPYPGCLRLIDVADLGRNAGPVSAGAARAEGRGADGSLGAGRPGAAVTAGPGSSPDIRRPGPDDVFTLLYTSGTTAFPKGAMISHRNAVPHGWSCGEVLRLTPDDRVLHAMSPAGTWGGVNIPLTAWSHGATLVLMETFDPLRALWLIEHERCTVWNAVDQMVIGVLDHPALDRHDRSSLRTGGFAATAGGAHGLFEAFTDRIGVRLAYQPYGMTEVNAMALVHDLDEPAALRQIAGIHPVPGLEVRIAHYDTGEICAAGAEGELQFRGPRVTRGYYRKAEETAQAFTDDGWFRSGDLGVQDDQGHTIFKGRLREALRISHQMVAPGEIEAFLMSHPAVAQAFVVGVPDPRTNEAAVAFVILREGASLGATELEAYCRGRIASFKIPRAVHVVADVPRTPGPHGDKVQRGKLREMAMAKGDPS